MRFMIESGATCIVVTLYGDCSQERFEAEVRIATHRAEQLSK